EAQAQRPTSVEQYTGSEHEAAELGVLDVMRHPAELDGAPAHRAHRGGAHADFPGQLLKPTDPCYQTDAFGLSEPGADDAQHTTVRRQQRTPGVAGVHRGVRL